MVDTDGGAAVPSDAMQYKPALIAPFLASPVLLLALVWVLITTRRRRSLRRSREKALREILKEE